MVYEYRCKNCETLFEVKATISEKAEGINAVCPQCGSTETSQSFGGIGILTGSRTSGGPSAPPGGPACGPGCC